MKRFCLTVHPDGQHRELYERGDWQWKHERLSCFTLCGANSKGRPIKISLETAICIADQYRDMGRRYPYSSDVYLWEELNDAAWDGEWTWASRKETILTWADNDTVNTHMRDAKKGRARNFVDMGFCTEGAARAQLAYRKSLELGYKWCCYTLCDPPPPSDLWEVPGAPQHELCMGTRKGTIITHAYHYRSATIMPQPDTVTHNGRKPRSFDIGCVSEAEALITMRSYEITYPYVHWCRYTLKDTVDPNGADATVDPTDAIPNV
jgi:hypothetical protein